MPTISESIGDFEWPTGGADNVYSEIRHSGQDAVQWHVAEFAVPGLGYYSNPIHCGSMIAYWRLAEVELSAAVFDAERSSIVRLDSVGQVHLETDNPAALPAPEWNADCESVRFHLDRWIAAPIDWTLSIAG